MKLRNYQTAAVDSIFKEWEDNSSTLAVLPTGTGKTQIFCEVIRRSLPRRTVVLTHRSELVFQAVERLRHFGIEADVEMADFRASTASYNRRSAIVATVQTLASGRDGGRKMKFRPDDFGVLIADEAHHFVAPQFKSAIDYFRTNLDLKVLGVTATPDRASEEALGIVFETVAYDYEILDAITDGWLVPVEQRMISIEGLDFSHIRTTAGDLNGADLAMVMEAEKPLHGIADATVKEIGDRRTLVFAVSVKQAEMYAEIFNRHKPGIASWVCGMTPTDERWKIFQSFKKGSTQILCNVGVATEGFDLPAIEVIVMARPTKSRCLYAQMAGRSLRPIDVDGKSIVDQFESPEARKQAIRLSPKPLATIIDFVGNSGRHKLITTADILGGKYPEEVVERASERARKEGKPVRMDELLEEEIERMRHEKEERDRREAARKARLVGKATYSMLAVDPFNVFDIRPGRERGWEKGKTFSEKQLNLLRKQGIDPAKISYHEGQQIIGELVRRWTNKLATLKQCALLRKHGYEVKDLKMADASKLIDALAKNNWRRPVDENVQMVASN